MLKIPRKISVKLSLAVAVLFMVGLLAATVFLPNLVEALIEFPAGAGRRGGMTAPEQNLVLLDAYGILALCGAADGMLITLLLQVKKGRVFSALSIGLVRGVSWCAIGLGLLFAVLGGYFWLSLPMGFLCLFLGLCLRVVKNVIEEATVIKEENDLTV